LNNLKSRRIPPTHLGLPPDLPIYVQTERRDDRQVPTCSYLATHQGKRVLVLILNTAHPLITHALSTHRASVTGKADPHPAYTLAWWIGIAWAERLMMHHRDLPLQAALARVRRLLVPPDKQDVRGLLFLASCLASSQPVTDAVAKLLKTDGHPLKAIAVTVIKCSQD
jgi:hypothetical protein